MPSPAKQSIAVVGGGWAGLAAAVELCQHGHSVTVFESSPQLGGRARSIEWNGMTLDNGQHLMIGAYQQMLSLLDTMQADVSGLFKQLPHRMLMLDANTGSVAFDLKLPTFPAPLHLLFGVFKIPCLTLIEKFQVLIRFNRLLNTAVKNDLPVSDWLISAKLPETYIKNLLEPICLAALTTHPQQASAKAFQSVLQQTFNAPANYTDLFIPTTDLGQVFPAQAKQFILQHGGKIRTRSKVQSLKADNNRITAITVENKEQLFEQIILATPARITARLLSNIHQAHAIVEQINQLQYEPVTTLYLQFKQAVKLPAEMTGIVNGYSEWVFERASSGHNTVLAVVISAQGKHLQMPAAELTGWVLAELKQAINDLPELLDSKLIVEKRATIQCHPDVDQYRPGIHTHLSNLKLCGDYVYIEENNQPGLPSTLEGALRSGVKCAQSII